MRNNAFGMEVIFTNMDLYLIANNKTRVLSGDGNLANDD